MLTVSEIDDKLERFLAEEQSLDHFHQWFAKNTWNITKEQPDSEARTLAGQIELALAEYSEDHLTLRDLRKRLSKLVSRERLAANQDS